MHETMELRNSKQTSERASKQCKSQPNSAQLNVCRLKFIAYAHIQCTLHTIVSVSCCVYFCAPFICPTLCIFHSIMCFSHFTPCFPKPLCPHCPISLPPCSIGVCCVCWSCVMSCQRSNKNRVPRMN